MSALDVLTQPTNKEEWRRKAKEILDSEEMKDCTFKPKTNTKAAPKIGRPITLDDNKVLLEETGDKCEDLYNYARVK